MHVVEAGAFVADPDGGVQGAFPAEAMSARELATRKAAGNVVELVSFAAVGFVWPPLSKCRQALGSIAVTHRPWPTFQTINWG